MKTRRIGPIRGGSPRAGLHEPQPPTARRRRGGGASAAARRARSRHRLLRHRGAVRLRRQRELVGRTLAADRSKFVLASKCGLHGVDGDGVSAWSTAGPRRSSGVASTACKRLRTDHIDLFYLHRWDRNVPIEDSVGALAIWCARARSVRSGLGSVGRDAQARAHAVHPIAAVQTEYSLWTRNPEIAVLDACRELGAPSSPSARWHAGLSRRVAARRGRARAQGSAPQHAALRAGQLRGQPEAARRLCRHRR